MYAIRGSSLYHDGWPEYTDLILMPTGVALVLGRALWSGLDFLEVNNPRLCVARATTGLLFVTIGVAACRVVPEYRASEDPVWATVVKAFLIAFGLFGLIRIRWTYPVAAAAVVIRAAAAAALLPEPTDLLAKTTLWDFASSRSVLSWSLSIGIAALALAIYAVRGLRWDAK